MFKEKIMISKMFKLFKKKKIEGFYYIEGENTGLPMSWHLITSRETLKTYNFSSEENAEQYAKIYFPNFMKTQSLHILKHPLDFININITVSTGAVTAHYKP